MMAQPKRNESLPASLSAEPAIRPAAPWGAPTDARPASGGDYAVGGEVGQMHLELAQRLATGLAVPAVAPAPPHERIVRFLSVAGGFAALAAAYAGVAIAVLH